MLDVSGHLRNVRRETGYEDSCHPVTVNCCGYQTFLTKDFSRHRPDGRVDYQIIYIFKGKGHYKINGQWTALSAGNIILYRPMEPQYYSYYGQDNPEVYWIHFTGNACETLLAEHGISNCFIGENLALKALFHETMLELQLKKPLFETIINSNFYKMLALIDRSCKLQSAALENNFCIDRLVIHLNKHYMEAWTIASMARFCSLSNDYFSHSFKKRMGLSPMCFLNQLRLEKARELLFDDSLSVSSVASLVGYEDPLYFSRAFKKATGYSPKNFHKNTLRQNTPF